ncbi:hypothetical protein L9F63_000567, partial [Diploptera punctata]
SITLQTATQLLCERQFIAKGKRKYTRIKERKISVSIEHLGRTKHVAKLSQKPKYPYKRVNMLELALSGTSDLYTQPESMYLYCR